MPKFTKYAIIRLTKNFQGSEFQGQFIGIDQQIIDGDVNKGPIYLGFNISPIFGRMYTVEALDENLAEFIIEKMIYDEYSKNKLYNIQKIQFDDPLKSPKPYYKDRMFVRFEQKISTIFGIFSLNSNYALQDIKKLCLTKTIDIERYQDSNEINFVYLVNDSSEVESMNVEYEVIPKNIITINCLTDGEINLRDDEFDFFSDKIKNLRPPKHNAYNDAQIYEPIGYHILDDNDIDHLWKFGHFFKIKVTEHRHMIYRIQTDNEYGFDPETIIANLYEEGVSLKRETSNVELEFELIDDDRIRPNYEIFEKDGTIAIEEFEC